MPSHLIAGLFTVALLLCVSIYAAVKIFRKERAGKPLISSETAVLAGILTGLSAFLVMVTSVMLNQLISEHAKPAVADKAAPSAGPPPMATPESVAHPKVGPVKASGQVTAVTADSTLLTIRFASDLRDPVPMIGGVQMPFLTRTPTSLTLRVKIDQPVSVAIGDYAGRIQKCNVVMSTVKADTSIRPCQ
jgi:hypothetical protein